jgi:H+/Cl- antiporter ClcA
MSSDSAEPAQRDVNYLRLIGLGAAIGIPAALLAAAFLALVHDGENWLWTDLPSALGDDTPPWYLVVVLPVAGAALVWVARRMLPGDGGHEPLKGIGGGPTPWRYAPSVALAALGTLVFGAVLGPEAPVIALGSIVGMVFVSLAPMNAQETNVLATAGSFSAVSALFGGPLVAGILLLESGVGLGAAVLPALLPGLVAAGVGYVLFVGLGSWGGINEAGLTVPDLPAYTGTHITDLLLSIVVGIVTALIILAVRRGGGVVNIFARRRMAVLLFGGALAVGLLAEGARLLGANSQDVLFSGQASVPAEVAQTSAATLLVLLIAKALCYSICLGNGFRGGPVFPAIFIGVAVASFAHIWFSSSPTWAIAVGTGAGMAAGTGLIFSALLFALLIVGKSGVDAMPAVVFAVAAAWLAAKAIRQRFPQPPPAVQGGQA